MRLAAFVFQDFLEIRVEDVFMEDALAENVKWLLRDWIEWIWSVVCG